MSKFILFLFATSLSLNTFAWKETGGGCEVNGIICDEYENAGSTVIDPKEIYKILIDSHSSGFLSPFSQFSSAHNFAKNQIEKKHWYLEKNKFNPELCGMESTIDVSPSIIACQDKFSVRIQENWWNKASLKKKSDIILHEAIMTYALENHVDLAAVRVVFRDFKMMMTTGGGLIRHNIYKLGFPFFFTEAEIQMLYNHMDYSNTLGRLCSANQKDSYIRELNLLFKELIESIYWPDDLIFTQAAHKVLQNVKQVLHEYYEGSCAYKEALIKATLSSSF